MESGDETEAAEMKAGTLLLVDIEVEMADVNICSNTEGHKIVAKNYKTSNITYSWTSIANWLAIGCSEASSTCITNRKSSLVP